MTTDPLTALANAIASDPRCQDFRGHRTIKDLDRFTHEFGPRDILDLTHPRTSTEFFTAWTSEGPSRLSILRGPARQLVMEHEALKQSGWTDAYRRYHDEFMNARAYLFQARGILDDDIEAPFYGVWAAEEASLHEPGHDDFGEVRSDKKHALCVGMYASVLADDVVNWLVNAIAKLDARTDAGLPSALEAEQIDLERWPARVANASLAEYFVVVKPDASRVREVLDVKRLYTMFPRDHRGRLRARQRVLLQPVSAGSDRDRRPWIVAIGPSRAGGQEITIDVEGLIGANQLERFDLATWCWHGGGGELDDPRTWGYTTDWARRIDLFLRGDVKEALEASGLRLDEAVSRLARGSEIGLLHPDPLWPKVTRDRLCRMAPWLLLGPGLDSPEISSSESPTVFASLRCQD